VIVYPGQVDDAREVTQFFRREAPKLKALRRLVISREKAVVYDVNNDGIEFPGLTYGNAVLDELLRELHVVFQPAVLHNPDATPGGVKEFRLTARHAWGEDRVM